MITLAGQDDFRGDQGKKGAITDDPALRLSIQQFSKWVITLITITCCN